MNKKVHLLFVCFLLLLLLFLHLKLCFRRLTQATTYTAPILDGEYLALQVCCIVIINACWFTRTSVLLFCLFSPTLLYLY